MAEKKEDMAPYAQFARALSGAQGEFAIIEKDGWNPFFKARFATFAACERMARPILKKYGLSVVQSAPIIDGFVVVKTKILHESGLSHDSECMAKPKDLSPQNVSACISYLRRVGFCMALGLVADEDVDGENTAEGRQEQKAKVDQALKSQPAPPATAKFDPNNMAHDELFYARLRENRIDESVWQEIRKKFIGQPWGDLRKIVESVTKS